MRAHNIKITKRLVVLTSLTFLLTSLSFEECLSRDSLSIEIVRHVGTVEILRKGQTQWERLDATKRKRKLLFEGEKIRTHENTKVDLKLTDDNLIRLKENTIVDFTRLSEKIMLIEMGLGQLLGKLEKIAPTTDFKIKTPTAVCGVRGTNFYIKSEEKSKTDIAVSKGALQIYNRDFPDKIIDLADGMRISAIKAKKLRAPSSVLSKAESKGLRESTLVGKALYDNGIFLKLDNNQIDANIIMHTLLGKGDFKFEEISANRLDIISNVECLHDLRDKIKIGKGLVKNIRFKYEGERINKFWRNVKSIEVTFNVPAKVKVNYEESSIWISAKDNNYTVTTRVIEGLVYVIELDMFGNLKKKRFELAAGDTLIVGAGKEPSVEISTEIPPPPPPPEDEGNDGDMDLPDPPKGVSSWTLSNVAGFGDANNISTKAMVAFKGTATYTYLYAGTLNDSGRAGLYRSTAPVSSTSWQTVTPSSLGNEQTAIMCFALDKPVGATKIYMGTGTANNAPVPGEVWRSTTDGSSASWSKISSVGDEWQVDNSDGFADSPSITGLEVVGDYIYVGVSFNRHNAEIWRINTASDTFEQILTKDDISNAAMAAGRNCGKVAFIRYHSPYIYIGLSPLSGKAGTLVIRGTFTEDTQDSISIDTSANRISNWENIGGSGYRLE